MFFAFAFYLIPPTLKKMKKQKKSKNPFSLLSESVKKAFRSFFFYKKNDNHERWRNYLASL